MSKNIKTYLLIAAMLGVWGTIGYKIINGISSDKTEVVTQDFNVSFKPKVESKSDTFSIKKVNKDPFLGTLASINKKANKILISKVENMPTVTYSGLIKKQNASDQVFIVTINSTQYLLKQGQTADSIRLIKGTAKAVTVKYKNKFQTINRK